MEICTVATRSREEMVDITGHVCAVIREKAGGGRRGAVLPAYDLRPDDQ